MSKQQQQKQQQQQQQQQQKLSSSCKEQDTPDPKYLALTHLYLLNVLQFFFSFLTLQRLLNYRQTS
jgi:hypothetical protein